MSDVDAFPADRTAVLTGAGSPRGIGRATADHLAAAGWSVAILDINEGDAIAAAEDVRKNFGVNAAGIRVDVSDEMSVDRAVSEIEASMPPIVGLCNLAGISSPTPFLSTTLEEWEKVFAVNTRGAFLMSKRVLPGMIERRIGRITSISSISAQRGGGTYSKVAYSASKAALLGFTRALAREVGEFGITVNAVAPGPIDTDIMGGVLSDERKQSMSEDIMLRRVGSPRDVAALLTFLMSAEAGYITAATYDINGGLQVS